MNIDELLTFDINGTTNTGDEFVDEDPDLIGMEETVHLRVQKITGRKKITIVEGLADDLDLKRVLRALKKKCSTNGTIVRSLEGRKVLQLQGDKRRDVAEFLAKYAICQSESIRIHGA